VIGAVHTYHDGTKHHFHRFARSLGYLDWASQPNPFRSFKGAAEFALHPRADAAGLAIGVDQSATDPPQSGIGPPHSAIAIGDILRHSLGLSAWKQFRESRRSSGSGRLEPVDRRWSLRVNPSSGNLHPTEAYVVSAPLSGISDAAAVFHYAPDRHALEQRCAFAPAAWASTTTGEDVWLLALTSIHWREAWKYGERAFRYCQHDLGHAIAAVRIAAERAGWRARLLPEWSHDDIAALTGIDRDEDYVEAEREEPGCLLVIESQSAIRNPQSAILLEAVRRGRWTGHANQLSEEHVQWTFIDDIAAATRDPGTARPSTSSGRAGNPPPLTPTPSKGEAAYARSLLLQRRSAVSFDGRGSIDAARCFAMWSAVMPHAGSPWDALWWDARIHCLLFVHRVNGLAPGLYFLGRHRSAADRLRAACGREFLWEQVPGSLPLFLLAPGDCRALAQRVSCDQAIAGEGFFSLGMLADFDASLEAFGPAFYRHLFWESGVVGQVLYLEAEAAGTRGTGIGCFFDDPVHDVLGLTGHGFQSLYHFTVGVPVEDTRLTTEPGYSWESSA
jgi:SagB-type dehydrogenase family enzyme